MCFFSLAGEKKNQIIGKCLTSKHVVMRDYFIQTFLNCGFGVGCRLFEGSLFCHFLLRL